jgi:flagellar basal body rod protein FlgG
MIYGLYQSAAGMMVNDYRQDVIANNLANAETPGFKREIATFSERQIAAHAGVRSGPEHELLDAMTGGLWVGRSATDFGEATLLRTEQAYDVALGGPGFFAVRDQQGEALLTRDGRMLMAEDGRLLSVTDGAEMLGRGGAPIRLNPRAGEPVIDEQGRIFQQGSQVGQLDVLEVDDYAALRKVGDSRFSAPDGESTHFIRSRVLQGFVENSGVQPVREMVGMLQAARAYQLNAQMITMQDQSAGRLLSTIANT